MIATNPPHTLRFTAPAESEGTSLPLMVFGVGATIAATIMTGVTAASGAQPWAWLYGTLGGISLWFSIAWFLIIRGGRRGCLRVECDNTGLTVVASRAMRFFEALVPAPITAATVWQLATGAPDLRVLIALIIVTVLSWKPLVVGGRHALVARSICLRPDGITLAGGRSQHLPWSSFEAATFSRKLRGVVFATPGNPVVFNPADLRSDPVLVTELISYYLAHPEHRDELGDHRSIQRVRFHQFVAPRAQGPGAL